MKTSDIIAQIARPPSEATSTFDGACVLTCMGGSALALLFLAELCAAGPGERIQLRRAIAARVAAWADYFTGMVEPADRKHVRKEVELAARAPIIGHKA